MKINSIKTALYLSFSVFIILTLVSVTTAWLSFNELKSNQLNLINSHIPALLSSQEMVVLGSQLSTSTHTLLTVKTKPELTKQWNNLLNIALNLETVLSKSEHLSKTQYNPEINQVIQQLNQNLSSINENILQSLDIKQTIIEAKIRLEWLKNDTLDEINPLINDLSFNLDQLLKPKQILSSAKINLHIDTLTLYSSIRNQINFISGIVSQTIDTQDLSKLKTSQLYSSQLIDQLRADSLLLKPSATTIAVTQSMDDFFTLISGLDNLFDKSQIKLELVDRSLNLVNINQTLLTTLNDSIKSNARLEEQTALDKSRQISKQIQHAQYILLVTFIISVSIAILIGWLYVKRSLVFRILNLNKHMRLIAEGDMNSHIDTQGGDEISSMAVSLQTFRDTLVETQHELVQAGKLAALGQLSAGVAHELNQPLAAIRNYTHNSKVLISREQPQQASEALSHIDELTEHMAEIITQFKQFSRKQELQIQPVSLSEALSNVLTLLENMLEKNAIELSLPALIGGVKVSAELIRLEQVFINIFTNAIDAMSQSKTKQLKISIIEKENICIIIKDTGCGINEVDKKHVFEPFYSTKKTKGLGLGLSISYNIMKDFNGSLNFKSEPNVGTEFIICLPVANTPIN